MLRMPIMFLHLFLLFWLGPLIPNLFRVKMTVVFMHLLCINSQIISWVGLTMQIAWNVSIKLLQRFISTLWFKNTISRVGKNPGFFNKTQPSGFFWVLLGFWGFIGFYWVLLSLDMLSLNIKLSWGQRWSYHHSQLLFQPQ